MMNQYMIVLIHTEIGRRKMLKYFSIPMASWILMMIWAATLGDTWNILYPEKKLMIEEFIVISIMLLVLYIINDLYNIRNKRNDDGEEVVK